jgi:formyl-CoA transferase
VGKHTRTDRAALAGLKVVEFAQLVAGPMAGTFLGDLGADVVHVEDPARGDPHRRTGVSHEGVYLWWKVSGRNKRSVTLDLRSPEGQDVARELVQWADVVITNFRADTLVKWGLDYDSLRAFAPAMIMLHVSGYGTNTSQRDAPGFGKVGEAMSGVVQLTGFPETPPVHAGFSHADSITALMGAFAIQAAVYRRDHDANFAGEYIDLALFETLYRLIEWQVVAHDVTGEVIDRAGNAMPMSPSALINTFCSSDGKYITVTSGTLRSVQNAAAMVGEDVADYDTVAKQEARQKELDRIVGEWVSQRPADEVLARMAEAEVVAAPIYSIADIMQDQTYRERGDIIELPDDDFGSVKMQAVIPHLSNYPGHVWRTGAKLGEDNQLVYRNYLGMDEQRYDALRERRVI